jgi:hypothetical protein
MNLIDLWKGEIEAMAFGDECDRFFEIFEVRDRACTVCVARDYIRLH